ncbi:MAG TPA: hypothetical protein VFK85_11115 [Anaeromyxobacteraceae bacterium]|nr:hypothetical protein [Anaeromyxobacteraceae bacterium]
MEPWSVAIALLVAVLAGAAIPLMFQLWMTIQSARRVAERLDRVTARLEEGERIDELLAAMDGITRAARQIGDGVKIASAIGAAIGPAAAAAINAWRNSQAEAEPRAAPSRDGDGPAQPCAEAAARVA